MNTEYLKEFVVLAETKNYWEASERLYMNQSTLSKHIKALEQELGVALFERTTRRVSLTAYGELFLPYANTISRTEYEATSAIKRHRNIENGLLTIGSLPSMPQYHITQFISRFQTTYPNTTVKITEADPTELFNYLINGTCELIFTREDKLTFEHNFMSNDSIMHIPYMKDRMIVLLPKNHPLAHNSSVTLQQLEKEDFCCIKEGSLMYQMSLDACHHAGFIPNIIFTSHRIDSILDMVTNQNCIALLMDQHVELPENGPRQINIPWCKVPIEPEINSQICLCYKTDRPVSKIAGLFIDFCQNQIFNLQSGNS